VVEPKKKDLIVVEPKKKDSSLFASPTPPSVRWTSRENMRFPPD
jgi:hypothetical protein